MNRKIMILMVAVVATVLPAVAVADVMITGSVTVSGSNISPFYIAEGPNYAAAHSAGVITWTSSTSSTSASPTMGTLDLEGVANQTVEMVNVLYFNYTGKVAGTFYFNITSNNMPSFNVYASSTLQTLSSISSWTPIKTGSTGNKFSVDGPFSDYVSFELPAGVYSGASLSVSIAFVAS